MRITALLALVLLLPTLALAGQAHATVLINEVAWMGTASSANAEWIELVNTAASAIDLTGWHLMSSTGSPSIPLAGSIAPGGYYLLERTRASNVAGVTADQVYMGALANTGATLTLTDAASTTEDQVVGGVNWVNIGGDNTSKETAQRIASGWETAAPTPRAPNALPKPAPATQPAPIPKPAPLKTSSHKVQTVGPALSTSVGTTAHGAQTVGAPASSSELVGAGAALPASAPPAPHSNLLALVSSPFALGVLGVLVFSGIALMVL